MPCLFWGIFMDILKAEYFFDLSAITFADLFDYDKVYQVLGKNLHKYILAKINPGIHGIIQNGVYLADDMIYIGKNTIVEAGAYIKGPTIIGDNCEIRQGAYIRGGVLVGNNCVIGHTTEIKSSIMLNGAKAAHFAYVGDSILGNHVNLGAGTKLANLKIYGDEISVLAGDYRYNTGLKKMGAILGDNVETGCNSTTSPGTLVGKNTKIYPNVMIGGFIKNNCIVKNKANIDIVPMIERR